MPCLNQSYHDLEHHQLGVFTILVSVMEFSERPLRGDLSVSLEQTRV